MRRTKFQVRIAMDERLPVNNFKQTVDIIDTSFTSTKYHCDCPGLRRQIEEEYWKPLCERYYIGGRYLMGITAIVMGVDQDRRKIKLNKRGAVDGYDS